MQNRVLLASIFGLSILSTSPQVTAQIDTDGYFRDCDKMINQRWQAELKDKVSPKTLRRYNPEAVVNFQLKKDGSIARVKLRHSSKESLRFSNFASYPYSNDELINVVDNSVLSTIAGLKKLPIPPKQLRCPRRMAVVFGPKRQGGAKLMLDESIPVKDEFQKWAL